MLTVLAALAALVLVLAGRRNGPLVRLLAGRAVGRPVRDRRVIIPDREQGERLFAVHDLDEA